MRKLFTATFALVAALAFFVIGSPSASAFGSEVLGCNAGFGWTANSCHSSAALDGGTLVLVNYSAANLSGTYTTSWSFSPAITGTCTAFNPQTPCIYPNSGCTAGSTSCMIETRVDSGAATYTAALTLTQSGQTRTISATATIKASLNGGGDPCPKC